MTAIMGRCVDLGVNRRDTVERMMKGPCASSPAMRKFAVRLWNDRQPELDVTQRAKDVTAPKRNQAI